MKRWFLPDNSRNNLLAGLLYNRLDARRSEVIPLPQIPRGRRNSILDISSSQKPDNHMSGFL
jgi:hypothetical protein